MHTDYPTQKRCRPMDIPSTPEQLFEQLAEPGLRELYPDFESLAPRARKILTLLHTELLKGELTDSVFMEIIGFTLSLWRQFNAAALAARQAQIEAEDEIDTDWVEAAFHLGRLDLFINTMINDLDMRPEAPEVGDSLYLMQGSSE